MKKFLTWLLLLCLTLTPVFSALAEAADGGIAFPAHHTASQRYTREARNEASLKHKADGLMVWPIERLTEINWNIVQKHSKEST